MSSRPRRHSHQSTAAFNLHTLSGMESQQTTAQRRVLGKWEWPQVATAQGRQKSFFQRPGVPSYEYAATARRVPLPDVVAPRSDGCLIALLGDPRFAAVRVAGLAVDPNLRGLCGSKAIRAFVVPAARACETVAAPFRPRSRASSASPSPAFNRWRIPMKWPA